MNAGSCLLNGHCCRAGADPDKVVGQIRQKFHQEAAAVHIPIGISDSFEGVVDVIKMVAYYNDGYKGYDFVIPRKPNLTFVRDANLW